MIKIRADPPSVCVVQLIVQHKMTIVPEGTPVISCPWPWLQAPINYRGRKNRDVKETKYQLDLYNISSNMIPVQTQSYLLRRLLFITRSSGQR